MIFHLVLPMSKKVILTPPTSPIIVLATPTRDCAPEASGREGDGAVFESMGHATRPRTEGPRLLSAMCSRMVGFSGEADGRWRIRLTLLGPSAARFQVARGAAYVGREERL